MKSFVRSCIGLGLASLALSGLLIGCGKTVTVENTEDQELVTEDFGSSDVQAMAQAMIDDLNSFPHLPKKDDGERLIILLSQVRNKTSEIIDMKNVMNSIKTGLLRGGKFRFGSDKERRQEILDELEYMESGAVDPAKAKSFGKQVGADVFLSGELTSIDKRADGVHVVHYKLSLKLEDIQAAEDIWMQEKEIRKRKG